MKQKARRDYGQLEELMAQGHSTIVDRKEVATILAHSHRSMPRLEKRAGFPAPLPTGGQKRWRLGDVIKWASAGQEQEADSRLVSPCVAAAAAAEHSAQSAQKLLPAATHMHTHTPFLFSVVGSAADAGRPQRVTGRTWQQFTESLSVPQARGTLTRAAYLRMANSDDSRECARARKEKGGEAWMPALFGETRNESGNLRWSGNVIGITALVLDVDNPLPHPPVLTLETLLKAVPKDVAVAWHTTFAHHEKRPRFRVIIPWRTAVTVKMHRRCFDAAQRRLYGALDQVTRSAAALFYLPSCPTDALSEYRTGTEGHRLALPTELLNAWESKQ